MALCRFLGITVLHRFIRKRKIKINLEINKIFFSKGIKPAYNHNRLISFKWIICKLQCLCINSLQFIGEILLQEEVLTRTCTVGIQSIIDWMQGNCHKNFGEWFIMANDMNYLNIQVYYLIYSSENTVSGTRVYKSVYRRIIHDN